MKFALSFTFLVALLSSAFHLLDARADEKKKLDVSKVYGRIQFVSSFPDYKVQVVKSFPDLKVEVVQNFASSAGKWQIVDSFPDYKIQLVESFPDFKIQYVNSFPGPSK